MMNNTIHIINTYIRLLLINATKSNASEALETLSLETNRLRHLLATRYDQNQKTNRFKDELNVYFTKLINISDELWMAEPANSAAKEALQMINHLIDHIQERYVQLVAETQALPLFRLQKLKEGLEKDLQPIQAQLKAKHINEQFIFQVLKAFSDLFTAGRYPSCSYAQEAYLLVFIPQLQLLAADLRTKDWERRLSQLLIKYNFNHMGVYKFLTEERKTLLAPIKDHLQVHQSLHELNVWLEQLQVIPNLAYQPKIASLKALLLKELQLHQAYLIEKVNFGKPASFAKLACNSSVNELSLFFHYLFEEGVYNYKTKREAANAICQHVQSIETKDISAHSLTKFDKLQLSNAAVKLYQRNNRIQRKLVADFDL